MRPFAHSIFSQVIIFIHTALIPFFMSMTPKYTSSFGLLHASKTYIFQLYLDILPTHKNQNVPNKSFKMTQVSKLPGNFGNNVKAQTPPDFNESMCSLSALQANLIPIKVWETHSKTNLQSIPNPSTPLISSFPDPHSQRMAPSSMQRHKSDTVYHPQTSIIFTSKHHLLSSPVHVTPLISLSFIYPHCPIASWCLFLLLLSPLSHTHPPTAARVNAYAIYKFYRQFIYTYTCTYMCIYIYNDSFKFIEKLWECHKECPYTLCPDNSFQLSTTVPEMAS